MYNLTCSHSGMGATHTEVYTLELLHYWSKCAPVYSSETRSQIGPRQPSIKYSSNSTQTFVLRAGTVDVLELVNAYHKRNFRFALAAPVTKLSRRL